MKKLFTFGKRKKRGLSPNTSDTGSTLSAAGYELKDKDLGKLHRAASSGDVAKIRQLLKKQDINQLDKENRTPLHLACANGYADAVTLLVERKSKLNLCDNDNRSPLMKAIQCQQECCATILLEHDADPNLVDINGNTALHLAALIPSLSIATQLLEHEADINAVNQEGCTPFILAVTENHQEMVAFLLQNEANVNAKDKNRRTPLMIAASNGQITLLKMLLEHDADISIKDVKGWTADDHAVMNGHHACSHLIIEHGSRKKSNASSPYYGTSKTRGASMFSSPDRMVGSGFTLGSPATDKEELQQTPKQTSRARDSGKVTEDISQAESESCTSEKSGEVHSWPSSNEEDLDFSPKKTPKPSLAQLFHTKKNEVGGSIKDENSNPRIHLGKSKQGVIANKPCSKLGIEDNVSGAICQEEENEVDNEEDGLQESEDKDEEGEDGVGEDKESEEDDDDDDDDYDDEGGREDQESVSENEVSEAHISEDEECEDLAENALTCLHDKSVDAQSIKQNVASKKIEIADDKLNAHVADKLLMDTSGIQDSFKSIQTTEAIPDCNDIPVSLIVGFYENVTSLIEGEVVLETYDQTDNHSDDIKEIPKDDKPINDESAIYISAQQDIDLDNNKNNTENYLQREKDETENLSGFIAEQDEEESSSDEADGKDGSYIEEDVERSPVRADLPFPGLTGLNNAEEKLQSVGRKTAALMSELGLEDDESPWDSESASESPGKQSASPLPSPAVQTHMQCISEESNDDTYYTPSFLRGSRNNKMQKPDVGWSVDQREFSEKNRALGLDKQPKVVQDISKIKDNSSILPLAKGSEGKAKPDVMADLGLDDADDIEDASDWDSTSHSLKCITHNQRTVGHLPLQTSEGRPLHTYSGTAALDTTNTTHITLQTVVELEAENYLHALKRDSVLGSSEKSLQKTQDSEDESSWESKENVHTPNSGENEKFPCAESPNLSVLKVKHDTEHMLKAPNLTIIPELGHHVDNAVILQQTSDFQAIIQNQEFNQDSSSDSELPWEERYENMWVDKEKKDVKTNFKDITAELKQKFGEISESKKKHSSSKTLESKKTCTTDMEEQHSSIDQTNNAEQEREIAVLTFADLQPIVEQKISSSGHPFSLHFYQGDQKVKSSNSLQWGGDARKKCQKPVVNFKQHHNSAAGKDNIPTSDLSSEEKENYPLNSSHQECKHNVASLHVEKHLGDLFSLCTKGLDKNVSHTSTELLGHVSSKTTAETLPSAKNVSEMQCCEDLGQLHQNVIDNHQPLRTELQSVCALQSSCDEVSSQLLNKELEQDMQRFKNEVGMLQAVFLNLTKERAQLQKEVDDKQKEKEQRRKMATKQLIGNGDLKSLQNIQTISDLVTKENVPSKAKSRIGPLKEKNAVFAEEHMKPRIKKKSSSRQAGDKLFHKPQITSVNGDPLEVFDDSTLSETSQEDNGRPPSKCANEKDKIDNGDDLDDFTQSSDTATEDCDSPTSTFRNAMLLIEQLSVEGQDSVNLLKIQNIIHEYERGIQRDNGRYTLLLGKVKKLENERKDLLQIIEKNRELKSILEHQKVEWGSDFNNLRFTLRQEEEKRKSAEMLYDKSRDQLRKKEDQCCKEMEEKQQHERTLRNLELELRSLRNSFKQVEDERNEAQRLLSQENHARALQESILNNLRRKNEELESKNILTKSAEVLSATSELSEREKDLLHRNATLQEEITVFKLELEQVRSRNNEEESRYMEENEMFKEKIDDLRRDLKMNEETLTQTVIQYNGQLNALKTESTMLCSKLEHEKQSKERLETETESIRSRLTSTLQELERNQTLKTDIERNLQRERDEWLRSQDKLSHDLSNIRENNNNLSQQLSRAEAKSNSLENELHRTILTLQEKTILLESTQRDLTQAQCRTKELERTIQLEKDQINKCTVKQESMQERLAQIQSENMLLRQQLEDVQNKGIIKEKAVTDVQDRFTDIFSKLRTDAERQVLMVEERNKDLINKSNELREQLYKLETEKVERESTLRQLQQELADALKKLSMSEASLEVITRYRNDLEEDKLHLQKELEKIKNKLQDLEEQFIQSERRNHQLKTSLDAKEREIFATSQKLQQFSTATAGAETSVKQLEEHVQKLEIENARIEAAAKQQAGRIEILQKELQESLLNRNRLEDLITTLQSSKIGLEEKLNQQVHKQSALSQSAHDSHNLWEEELKSRSRLGVRLAELDREKADLSDQVETERKKVKKLVELKRSMEARFDQEMKRNNELQREITGLKKLLKTAKKKLKECDGGELQQSSFQEGSKNKHLETESKAIRLKEKIEELSLHSERESAKYTQLESTNRDLQEQLSSMKILHKNHERLERINRQLGDEVGDLKKHVESNKVDQSLMEQYKREIEERGRQELRQKLEEVNLFLQTQAASQETLEQIRATNDASARNQLEHRIQDLESELGIIKNTQQDSMCQKETTQTELGRFKDLYMEELKLRKSLAAKLDRSHERLAEANAKLLNERQRSKSLIASSIVNGSLSASPVLDASQLGIIGSNLELNRSFGLGGSFLNSVGNGISPNRVESYLAKMQRELEKNISKELDQANAELETVSTRVSPVGSTAGSLGNLNKDQDPVSRATQQYLEVLKKNYKI
ncbi:ankyrin repeat domain-containing protein 26 isoform X4 [Ascaphus truei]|uniref:ankyrin repeat domain-containing protein 26 isoform X4 n=1 Tax=Ascaphus truei TaxID=8439 RepID=UPI003F5AC770